MKKTLFGLLIIGLVLCLGACNTDSGGEEKGPQGVDVVYDWGDPGAKLDLRDDSNAYPGREINLADCPNKTGTIGDISLYGDIILYAVLYDEDGAEITDKTNGLAQFSILKDGSSSWDDANKLAEKYNLVSKTDIPAQPMSGKTGKPGKLLVQGSYTTYEKGKVAIVEVQKLTFKPKTSGGDVVLGVVYGEAYVSTSGNQVTFTNAMYRDGAAIFVFPNTFPTTLTGKKLVIKFSIPEHDNNPSTTGVTENVEHQIHIQAANSDKQRFNGRNDQPGQVYITLDDSAATGWDGTGGTFSVPLNDLIAAANVTADADDCKGPFDLDAIRIVNNGTTWDDSGENHVRCKSYTLVIESVKVE